MADIGSMVSRLSFIALAVFPVAAGVTWPELVAERPVAAGLLALGYEVAVVGLAFGGDIAKKLKELWSERVAAGIDRTARRTVFGNGFAKRHRRHMLHSSRYIDQKGLKNRPGFDLDLDDVFVDVALVPRAPHQVSADVLARFAEAPGERQSLGELLERSEPAVLAVLGAPGSGKTTLLRHTARRVCRTRKRWKGRRGTPILLYLRDHVEQILSDQQSGLPEILREVLERRRLTEPPDWFQRRLDRGGCVVLLDGLDEVPRAEERRRVVAWVERQIERYPKNHFVVTSRPHGYLSTPLTGVGAVVLQTQRLTPEQVDRFVRQWYLAVERRNGHDQSDEEIHENAGKSAEDLLDRLRHHPELHELTVNPLLLTMITNVHHYRNVLPGSRAELYREVCEVMLWRRQEAKDLQVPLTGEQSEVVLREVAHTMMRRRVRDLDRCEILAEIGPGLARVAPDLEPGGFLADVVVSGLLLERENEKYAFAHQTFQEYLAASHLKDRGLPDDLAELVGGDWWRETFLLYAARADADPVVRVCLDVEHAPVPALALASECAEQARELAPELRDRLDEVLSGALDEGPDSQRRRLAVGVLLVRHLGETVDLPSGGRLCIRPITAKLYAQFQAMATDGAHRGPDAPEDADHSPEMLLGVRGTDAVAFVQWANGILDGQRSYRLPTRAELADRAPRHRLPRPDCAVWARADGDRPELWTPGGTASGAVLNTATLPRYVEADLRASDAPLPELLVVWSIECLRDLGLDLARARNRDRARDRVLGLDRAHTLARALARALARDRALDHARDRARDLALDLARARDLALDFALDRARDRARALARALSHARALARDRALDLDHTSLTGTALSDALSRTLASSTDSQGFVTAFVLEFLPEVGIGEAAYRPSFDTLAETAPAAGEALLQHLDPSEERSPHAWVSEVAHRLEELAVPVFTRRERLTPETATSIRLAALFLAAEADAATRGSALGDDFREIAAGVTLLQQRLNGEAPAAEMIMLALD